MATQNDNAAPRLEPFAWHNNYDMNAVAPANSHAELASCAIDFARGVETVMDIVHRDDALTDDGERPLLDVNARESLILLVRMSARLLNDQCVEHITHIDKCVKRQENAQKSGGQSNKDVQP